MVKSVLLLFFAAIGVGVVSATDMRSSKFANADTVHHASSATLSRVARQSNCTVTEHLSHAANVPLSCYYNALNINIPKLLKFDPNEIASLSKTICTPACGNPLLKYIRRCWTNATIVNVLYTQFCALNIHGKRCYSGDVATALFNMAQICTSEKVKSSTDECCTKIKQTIEDIGCCVNILDAGGRYKIIDPILKGICGVNVPEICSGSTISETAPDGSLTTVAPILGFLTVALAMLATIILQGLF